MLSICDASNELSSKVTVFKLGRSTEWETENDLPMKETIEVERNAKRLMSIVSRLGRSDLQSRIEKLLLRVKIYVLWKVLFWIIRDLIGRSLKHVGCLLPDNVNSFTFLKVLFPKFIVSKISSPNE